MKKNKKIYFRASSAAKLMVGGSMFWSPQDREKLDELDARSAGKFKTKSGQVGRYTDNMKADHEALEERFNEHLKRKEAGLPNFDLGKVAKSLVKSLWRELNYGYKEPMVVKETLKGIMTEQDCLGLLNEVHPITAFRTLTTDEDRKTNDLFSGLKDINYSMDVGFLEDMKSAWSLKQFMDVETLDDINPEYFGQGQIYMQLYRSSSFKVQYCLVNTPEKLVKQEIRRFRYKLGVDEDHIDLKEIADQLWKNHKPEDFIDAKERVKTFEFDFDPDYMKELEERVHTARKYFETIRLTKKEVGAILH